MTMQYARADFADPVSLQTVLWKAHYGEVFDPEIYDRFWSRDDEIICRLFPRVFSLANDWDPAAAMRELLREMGTGKHPDPERYGIPRGWFALFHAAFREGLITALAWGMAARIIYQSHGVEADNDGEHQVSTLEGLRDADPAGVMDTEETQVWLDLPPVLTIYRGSCTANQEDVAKGISWSSDPETAAYYAFLRYEQRRAAGGEDRPPRLTHAVVPRELVLAVLKWGEQLEYLVDYELIFPELIGVGAIGAQFDRMRSTFLGVAN